MIVEDWNSFLDEIKTAKEALKKDKDDIIWYRGQNNYGDGLLPSLLRYTNGIEKEQGLFNTFKKFSDRLIPKQVDDWETLFYMQHYGVPTRLLDWSETFGIALFFASYYHSYSSESPDAAIYLLNPVKLNLIFNKNKIFRIPEDSNEYPYINLYLNRSPFPATSPIAIEPIFINNRMLAQRGMFTVFSDNFLIVDKKYPKIEDIYPEVVKKIKLPNSLIPSALEFLDLVNINAYTVYPDLPGMADFLRKDTGLIYGL